MKKEIKDYLPFFIGQEYGIEDSVGVLHKYRIDGLRPKYDEQKKCEVFQLLLTPILNTEDSLHEPVCSFWEWPHKGKLILRPLSSMTEGEAVKLCSVYSPEAFGDYRFSKWAAVKDEANFCYNVTNPKSDMSFNVDIEKMHIKVYEDGNDTYPSIENHTYFTEYLKMGFDIFNLIKEGLAIDATTLNETK